MQNQVSQQMSQSLDLFYGILNQRMLTNEGVIDLVLIPSLLFHAGQECNKKRHKL